MMVLHFVKFEHPLMNDNRDNLLFLELIFKVVSIVSIVVFKVP